VKHPLYDDLTPRSNGELSPHRYPTHDQDNNQTHVGPSKNQSKFNTNLWVDSISEENLIKLKQIMKIMRISEAGPVHETKVDEMCLRALYV